MNYDIGLLVLGAAAGGFVSGLTGFGTALTAMPIWLLALSPLLAAQLAAASGVVAQLTTLPAIWPHIRLRTVLPYIGAGLIGVPIGVGLLPLINPTAFKLVVGCLIVAYCATMLFAEHRLRIGTAKAWANPLVGLIGGITGGIAGLSGPPVIIWATARALSKDDKRALFQSFNASILMAMLAANAANGQLSWDLGRALLIALPATLLAARIGHWLYLRLKQRRFDTLVLIMLAASGVTLIVANLGWR
jgi:uncharacterized protein